MKIDRRLRVVSKVLYAGGILRNGTVDGTPDNLFVIQPWQSYDVHVVVSFARGRYDELRAYQQWIFARAPAQPRLAVRLRRARSGPRSGEVSLDYPASLNASNEIDQIEDVAL